MRLRLLQPIVPRLDFTAQRKRDFFVAHRGNLAHLKEPAKLIVHVTDIPLVESMWPVVGPMLDKAVKHSNGCYELEDVLAEIRSGHQQLWVAWDDDAKRVDAAMTTMFDQYPRKKTLKVVFVGGGRMRTWLKEFIGLVEEYAKKNGAVMLEGFFREGWVKVWPGARVSGVGLVKELA